MRKIIALIVLGSVLFTACQDRVFVTRDANKPIYQDVSEWRATSFALEGPRKLSQAGKIYLYNNYLFVVEKGSGIHFIDNQDPHNPSVFGFLPVYACSDISVKNDQLYVDSYFDILVFDISDVNNPSLSSRAENAISFDDYTSLPGLHEGYPIAAINETDKVIIGWEIAEVTDEQFFSSQSFFRGNVLFAESASLDGGSTTGGGTIGIGGSMAQFTIVDNFLYTAKANQLNSFDIAADGSLSKNSSTVVDRTVETIFPYNNHLFLGTTTGMVIYDRTMPQTPQYVGHIDHVQSCDPVVVDGNRAYVTLSTSEVCWGTNQLDVIDVSNYSSPSILSSFWFTNPKGLGLDGANLFLCDGSDGLKVFDRSDDLDIVGNMISHFPGISTYDVIPYNGYLIMIGDDGIYQYDYSDINNIFEISLIPVS